MVVVGGDMAFTRNGNLATDRQKFVERAKNEHGGEKGVREGGSEGESDRAILRI